jgi:type II secretory pathway pseudopilin PulG
MLTPFHDHQSLSAAGFRRPELPLRPLIQPMKTTFTFCRPAHGSLRKGFTIVEVMAAAIVMALAISSSLIVLQHGMRAIDTARYTTLAGQILQSQMEKLRLLTWTQLTHPTYGPVAFPTFTPDLAATSVAQMNRFTAGGVTGQCAQSIVAAPAPFDTSMKEIKLTATWTGMDGRSHSLSYITYYGKNGLSDFFYTSH